MESVKKLTCRESVELVTDYLENSLLPDIETQFEAHLSDCSDCRVYLRQMQQTLDLLRHLTDETTPDEVKQELLIKFREQQH